MVLSDALHLLHGLVVVLSAALLRLRGLNLLVGETATLDSNALHFLIGPTLFVVKTIMLADLTLLDWCEQIVQMADETPRVAALCEVAFDHFEEFLRVVPIILLELT
jgi:hypothetical protein